jgi:molybdenum cofactor synthesis domain-containing protein
MMPLSEAQQLAMSHARALDSVQIPIDEALGCVTAADVLAPEDVPPFANTAMDGYAVRSGDTDGAPVELDVVGVLAAGAAPTVGVGPGEAIQIMTGAPIPDGADGIAIVERTEPVEGAGPAAVSGGVRRVRVLDEVPRGVHIRAPGSDITAGSVAVPAGAVLTPAYIGVLASVGAGAVTVHRKPRVGVMSTGDELVELAPDGSNQTLGPGQIRDSNRHALLATVRRDGFEAIDLGLVADTEEAVTARLQRALGECDAVLSTGGVSMGEFDYVKVVLSALAEAADGEAAVHVLRVAIRPAKPLVIGWLPALGRAGGGEPRLLPVFGLPGNPVSCLVSYQAIALPVLRVLAGHPASPPPTMTAVAGEDFGRRPDGKTHLVRVQLSWRDDGRLEARSAGGQMSHQLAGMAAANALAILPDGDGLAAGATLEVLPIGPVG